MRALHKREGAEKHRESVLGEMLGEVGVRSKARDNSVGRAWKLQRRPLDHHAPRLRASFAAFMRAAWASSKLMRSTRFSIAAILPA